MLDNHLIASTKPLANKENIVAWENYRVTVLQNQLFRLEYNDKKQYRDDATQSVWFRNMPAQKYKVEKYADCVKIITERVILVIKKDLADCFILLNGKEVPLSNDENLKGTYRTLDCCDGNYSCKMPWGAGEDREIVLGDGVCSKTGVAMFDDADSLSLSENGEVVPTRGVGKDLYIFAYGNNYREAVKALYMICGKTPLIPRFALGNWWSRYHAYDEREYLTLLQKFEDNNIPLTVATIDMDWHYSFHIDEELGITKSGKNTEEYVGNRGCVWTGYTWNKNLFPDYKAFLKKVKEKKLKITLNLHPADGVRWWEDQYDAMSDALGLDKSTQKQIPFNITDTAFINSYFSVLHKPYEKDGVDFWWIDWQQGTDSAMEGLDPLWSLNHYHYLDNAANHETPLILSRYAGIGSHRYPLGFSGDTLITWKTLQYLPYFTATASNIGYTWWSHDIGGHMLGEINGELYARHIQFGVFSPINRLHSSDAKVTTKEPWYYGNGRGEIIAKWLRFRHSMIPFLYTQSYRTHTQGKALVEPLYYEWNEEQAYEYTNEYIFGGNFLVAPITSPMEGDFAEVKAWMPKGKWTDIFTGDEYEVKNAREITLLRDLESIPVLAKAGTILPLSADNGNSCDNPTNLDVWVYNGDGEFSLIEDGREVGNAEVLSTKFVANYYFSQSQCVQTLKISAIGEDRIIPENRTITVYFKNIEKAEVNFKINGVESPVIERLADCVAIKFSFNKNNVYEISVSFEMETTLQRIKKHVQKILLGAECNNEEKCALFEKVEQCVSEKQYRKLIQESTLPKLIKKRVLEILQ